MFKGIIEGAGQVLEIKKKSGGLRLKIKAPFSLRDLKKGDSIATNGCCLTLVKKGLNFFEADVSRATLAVTR